MERGRQEGAVGAQEALPAPAALALLLDEQGEAVVRAGINALRALQVENAEVHDDDDNNNNNNNNNNDEDDDARDHQDEHRNVNNNIWNQDGGGADDGEAPGNIVDPYAPSRMVITESERNWALAIKGAIAGIPELDPISDFLCVQLALVEPTDMEGAIHRAQQLQGFREEYKVRDTLEDAQSVVQEFLNLFQNHILSFSYNDQHGCYICCIDVAACDKDLLVTERQWRTMLGGFFYLHQAMNPEFSSMRIGAIKIFECEGFNLSKMGGINTAMRLTKDLLAFYPTRHRALKYYHTGMFMNTMLAFLKPFLPKIFLSKIEVGCMFYGRLDFFYLIPSASIAQQRNYERIMDSMTRRYANEASFSL